MEDRDKNLYVVGIGASAGGLDAIQQLFDHIPDDTGMAFVIIQHLSPDFISLMPELLAKHTKMPIYTAEDKQTIQPNCIYLNQRSKNLHIKGRELYLLEKGPKHNLNLPIDIFFHTLGEEFKEKSIGVILSGTGSDGSRGIKSIKEGGGIIIVQDPVTAQFDGMPNSAISTNLVDFILNPENIASSFKKLPAHPLTLSLEDEDDSQSNENIFNTILGEVYKYSSIDFRKYKKNTLLRRLEKRMHINNIDQLYDYLVFLKINNAEKEALKQDFFIGVTRFFRDEEAFETLKNKIIPAICKDKKPSDTIRIWTTGCSTGEEVYSIAILFDSYIRTNKLNLDFKFFATDVDSKALNIASSGAYHINTVNEIEKTYLEQYFLKTGDKIQIIKRIREKIVFSNHNLINDPPFIKMDLISCRNLLIYLDSKIQKKIMHNFQFALNKFSYLFLGSSESIGDLAKLFKAIDVKWKIYQNITETKYIPIQSNTDTTISNSQFKNPLRGSTQAIYKTKENPESIYHKYLSKEFSPPSIFIDKDFNILYIIGDAGKKLNHNDGLFQNNLLKIVSPEIASMVRSGIRKLEKEEKDIIIKDIINTIDNEAYSFDLRLKKPKYSEELKNTYVLQFSPDRIVKENSIVLKNIPIDEISKQRLEDLENELKATRTELQNVVEELETSNEELQSSNEELMASNEELQSTNEELQSVNEELYTVNSELQEKNKELQNLNNDITNLFNSTDIGTLFLDSNLKIRKFTPSLQKHFNLYDNDFGRPISSFTSNFDDITRTSLLKDCKNVLKNLNTIEKEIIDLDGNHYLNRISPFVTEDKKIDGVVVTLVDINPLKEINNELDLSKTKYKTLFENMNKGFIHAKIITNENNEAINWEYITINAAYEKQIGLSNENVIGKKAFDILPHLKNDTINWLKIYQKTAQTGVNQSFEYYSNFDKKYYLVLIYSPIIGEFAVTFSDITELKEKENKLLKNEAHLTQIQSLTKTGGWSLNLKTNEVIWTEELYKMFGLDPSKKAPSFDTQEKLYTKESWEILTNKIENTIKTGEPYEVELNYYKTDGTLGWLLAHGELEENNINKSTELWGSAQDITATKNFEKSIIEAKKEAEQASKQKNLFLANMSHEIRTPMNGVIGFSSLLRDDNLTESKRNQYLNIIDNSSKQLINLIDDIIDISKIEAGELKIIEREFNLTDSLINLETTYNQLKNNALKKDINIVLEIPKNKKLVITSDEKRINQLLINLLNNALKFTEQGEIKFGYNIKGSKIQFFVSDTGIGIPKEKLEEIFESFKQVDYNTTKYGGTGLGLAISKGIINILNGWIKVESTENKGTTFTFEIPLKIINDDISISDESKIIKNKEQFLKGKKVLIAEDEYYVRLYLEALLQELQVNYIMVNDGEDAIAEYKKSNDFDLVLMDVRMPKVNGLKATKEILKFDSSAKIIMQTAYAMLDEREKCIQIGSVGYLTKPLDKDKIINEMFKALH
ncbi:chemotaxis protein CheB [Lutibacter sp.]|uniref:chemotaxis protein CheB n=1 Tax=Lutibacter sp. TaxID=1925666 RepID=UPI003561A880